MSENAILPILLVRNEEWVIAPVLEAAVTAFGWALVGDTGSTDATPEIARATRGARVVELGRLDSVALGRARWLLAQMGREMGATWGFQVDGDELYDVEKLSTIAASAPPSGKRAGFTRLATVDYDEEAGEFWEMDDVFSRLALFPLDDEWRGEYPFEAPAAFSDPTAFFYYPAAEGDVHGVHLHRLCRSPRDEDVFMRAQKRFQFALQDKPHIRRVARLREPFATILGERYAPALRRG